MEETKELITECRGGIGKFAIEICKYCRDLNRCEIALKDYIKYIEEQKERLKNKIRKPGKIINIKDLRCMYCSKTTMKCRCYNKSEARFELLEKKS